PRATPTRSTRPPRCQADLRAQGSPLLSLAPVRELLRLGCYSYHRRRRRRRHALGFCCRRDGNDRGAPPPWSSRGRIPRPPACPSTDRNAKRASVRCPCSGCSRG
ncbi:unnamed protein product, partial [Ectocarpus sp. 8 AP-2014]